MPAEVLLVDHLDSFTYNLADLLHRVLGRPPVLWGHDHPAGAQDLRRFAAVVIGPGPGRPQVASDLGLSELVLRQSEVPVLGVCLGHQGLAHVAGEEITEMALTRHGIVSPVEHDGTGIFAGVPSPVRVVRYHSLEVREPLRSRLRVSARAVDDGCVMGLADPDHAFWGVQFHPESVLSEHGDRIVENFLALAGVERGPESPSAAVAVGDAMTPQQHRDGGRMVRLRAERVDAGDPVDVPTLRDALVGDAPASVWLDSSDGTGWSLVADGRGPLGGVLSHRVGQRPPLLDRLDAELDRWQLDDTDHPIPAHLPWRPGLVGYWGYELQAETGGSAAHVSATAAAASWPDAWFMLVDRGAVVDHVTGEVWAVWIEDEQVAPEQERWRGEVEAAVRAAEASTGPRSVPPPSGTDQGGVRWVARDEEEAYLEKVRAAQAQIARGESYEVCLTTAYRAHAPHVDEAQIYRALREVSPVPHGAWLRTPHGSVLSGSPERFVSVADGTVEARPIKGTRPRGADPQQDADLVAELAASVKDRAENLMIVDLLRNDLHRVCRSGSVHVPELFAVETYATVHQLVSTIRGELAPGMRATDVLRACFPGGSMTGAPKVRTMEILDRLEGQARGVYSGALGWVGLDGSMDTSIVIRTLTRDPDGTLALGVGGAVTALSDPDEEYAEVRTKARAVLAAVERAALSPAGPGRSATAAPGSDPARRPG
ncbi:Para-aminobenzoate synthase, aminase component [Serinicoccus hydrothermalis]|uniref:aminodeoxychorismate synthase n=1 Tax=Serinicoccus hydrothermalis TaxID=1758689 RepID=A0A1B1NEX3_9MICO|nr:aminodeoxychorismate synthase component I [Serinicoccus hydrothermalis]ANS79961.1 Para-aminobenzoate synthase, aminase component [Serinicoccus hydrothermalis]